MFLMLTYLNYKTLLLICNCIGFILGGKRLRRSEKRVISQQTHDVVSTSIRRLCDVDDVV